MNVGGNYRYAVFSCRKVIFFAERNIENTVSFESFCFSVVELVFDRNNSVIVRRNSAQEQSSGLSFDNSVLCRIFNRYDRLIKFLVDWNCLFNSHFVSGSIQSRHRKFNFFCIKTDCVYFVIPVWVSWSKFKFAGFFAASPCKFLNADCVFCITCNSKTAVHNFAVSRRNNFYVWFCVVDKIKERIVSDRTHFVRCLKPADCRSVRRFFCVDWKLKGANSSFFVFIDFYFAKGFSSVK